MTELAVAHTALQHPHGAQQRPRLYGTGMRVLEGLRVRVRDVDFAARMVTVREGKGDKDRRTMLPRPLVDPLLEQLESVRRTHEKDRKAGYGEVWLPHALARKYPNAGTEWGGNTCSRRRI